jgi:hypothetical protein
MALGVSLCLPTLLTAQYLMRDELNKVHRLRWILPVILLAACLPSASCRPFAPREKSSDAGKANSTKAFPWNDLRDERAVEIERHMNEHDMNRD